MPAIVHCDSRQLLGLAALSDFLVRSRQSGAAVAATDRLAGALLAYERALAEIDRTAGAALRREAVRLAAEVALLNHRLRRGPVRHAPSLRRRVEALVLHAIIEPPAGPDHPQDDASPSFTARSTTFVDLR